MKSHPSEGGEIVLEKGHGTNPEREDAISFPLLSLPLEDSNEESVVLGRLASTVFPFLSSFHPPFPSSVFARRRDWIRQQRRHAKIHGTDDQQ